MPKIPNYDIQLVLNGAIDLFGTSQKVDYTGTAASSNAIAGSTFKIHSTTDCWVRLNGTAVVNGAGSHRLLKDTYFDVKADANTTVLSVIRESANGSLFISEAGV